MHNLTDEQREQLNALLEASSLDDDQFNKLNEEVDDVVSAAFVRIIKNKLNIQFVSKDGLTGEFWK